MLKRITLDREKQIAELEREWANSPRWVQVKRGYSAEDVVTLRGSFQPQYSYAQKGAENLWRLINGGDYVNCLGAVTGGQAVQQAESRYPRHLSVWLAGCRRRQHGRYHVSRPIALSR